MSKKVVFNGIEILTNEDDSSARSLLGFVESIIDHLEFDIDQVDENFNLRINLEFSPSRPIKHSFSMTRLSNKATRKKVLKILDNLSKSPRNNLTGTMSFDLQVQDSHQ